MESQKSFKKNTMKKLRRAPMKILSHNISKLKPVSYYESSKRKMFSAPINAIAHGKLSHLKWKNNVMPRNNRLMQQQHQLSEVSYINNLMLWTGWVLEAIQTLFLLHPRSIFGVELSDMSITFLGGNLDMRCRARKGAINKTIEEIAPKVRNNSSSPKQVIFNSKLNLDLMTKIDWQ
jgi:hypothetical protein